MKDFINGTECFGGGHELFECDIYAKFMFIGLGTVRKLMKNI
jgi:hypothetical protein